MSILHLVRPDLLNVRPYSSARMEAIAGNVWLNANESPWLPLDQQVGVNRYPEPQPKILSERLAELYGVDKERILVGRGSDEPIDLLTRAFCRAGIDNILISPPTFGMYAVAARVQGAFVREVPLLAEQGFACDFSGILRQVSAETRLVYVCTPNNPTGNVADNEKLRELASALRNRALLIVDEAYAEFSDAPSMILDIDGFDNLVVLRTLSKAHGLAGARIGVAIAGLEIIGLLRRIMAPYPLPSLCVTAAMTALTASSLAVTQKQIQWLRQERAQLFDALTQLPYVLNVFPSEANFLTVRCVDAERVYATLSRLGIVVRSLRNHAGLEDALRISIGTPQENLTLLAALRELGQSRVLEM